MLSFLSCLLFSPLAQAVPLQITQQGRMLDSSGTAVDGSQIVVFRVYDAETGGTQLWEEYLTVQFNNGYYATVLGVDESGNPLDSETLSLYPVFLEIALLVGKRLYSTSPLLDMSKSIGHFVPQS